MIALNVFMNYLINYILLQREVIANPADQIVWNVEEKTYVNNVNLHTSFIRQPSIAWQHAPLKPLLVHLMKLHLNKRVLSATGRV